MNVSIFGLGYVGSVSAACFASMGHKVVGVDVSAAKVEMVNSGRSPIQEAGMNDMVAEQRAAGRLKATTDASLAVGESDLSFVCVGTPSLRSGKLDLSHVEHVMAEIGSALRQKKTHHTVVLRSTVLPGTTTSVVIPILESTSGKRANTDFAICYNPEFMRESSAVSDFFNPPYTVFGASHPDHLVCLKELYKGVPGRVFEVDLPVAEMVKYVSNLYHAIKVGFANEIGTLCQCFGLDTSAVTEIFTSDNKLNISSAYLKPGFAFGGSCLPKDLRAMTHRAKELDLSLPLLESIIPSNSEHIGRAVDGILQTGKKKISMLGLSFKAGTDDLRESPQVQLIKRLLGEGCQVRIWDEDVSIGRLAGSNRQYIEEVIPHIGSLLSTDFEAVVRSGEIVVIGTKLRDPQALERCLSSQQVVFDLVYLDRAKRPQGAASYQGICW
ncbi:MAG TPA: UDP-glucose/GDP-mannose dehydrogenase family protein [Candidatus Sulfotelmatobacter sp.]|nr:UDP-glucose/GDP-mannose dehydrogenase family protein [Candidatus Sulfotelmatobacter sp.]